MFKALYSYYHYGKAILFKTLPFTKQPNTSTVQVVSAVLDNFKDSLNNRNDEFTEMLDACTSDEILLVTDLDGYNLLQYAIIQGNSDMVQYIVARSCNVNTADCSTPLHLAAFLGQDATVDVLMAAGAKVDELSGMCYPHTHHTDNWMGSKFFFISKKVQDCYRCRKLPVHYAIEGDHLEIAQKFLKVYNKEYEKMFHYACQYGAFKCMKHFAGYAPHAVNEPDESGIVPLYYAAQWGPQFIEFLVNNGARTNFVSNDGTTLLHVLYSNTRNPLGLSKSTKFLLGSGLEQCVGQVDSNGDTALHVLVQLVSRDVATFCSAGKQLTDNSPHNQAVFNTAVLDSIDMLLQHNCDPFVNNASNQTALTLLLEGAEVAGRTAGQRAGGKFILDLDVISDAMTLLLVHSKCTDRASYCLLKVLHIMSRMHINTVLTYSQSYLRCIDSVCQHGADPNALIQGISPVVYLIVSTAGRCIAVRSNGKEDLAGFIDDVLRMLLGYGLNPNHGSSKSQDTTLNGLTNFIRLVQYVLQPSDIQFIHRWVLTLLQHGADPDMEPYASDPIICHSQSSIFLKHKHTQAVNQYMDQIQDYNTFFYGGYAESLLLLFYNTMDHHSLYQCLTNIRYTTRFTSEKMPSLKFNEILSSLSSSPRSLKQMSRVVVHKALDRKLINRVDKLPLPGLMKGYLLDIY